MACTMYMSATYAQMSVLVAPMADPIITLLRSTRKADLQVARQGVVPAASGCLWHVDSGIAAKMARCRPSHSVGDANCAWNKLFLGWVHMHAKCNLSSSPLSFAVKSGSLHLQACS